MLKEKLKFKAKLQSWWSWFWKSKNFKGTAPPKFFLFCQESMAMPQLSVISGNHEQNLQIGEQNEDEVCSATSIKKLSCSKWRQNEAMLNVWKFSFQVHCSVNTQSKQSSGFPAQRTCQCYMKIGTLRTPVLALTSFVKFWVTVSNVFLSH